jgi:hypothetical protein
MLMSSSGIYGSPAGHRMPRRTLTSPLYLPLPISILIEYADGMTRQEHASLTCAAGERRMSLTCAAASSPGIRRETRLVKRRACLLPRTVTLHALSSPTRAAARRSIFYRAASLPHTAMHYDTHLQETSLLTQLTPTRPLPLHQQHYNPTNTHIYILKIYYTPLYIPTLTCTAGDTNGRTGRLRVRACAAPTCMSRQT